MQPAFVPPSGPVTREMILASTKPRSVQRTIWLALYALGIGRTSVGFPYILWAKKGKRE